MGFKETLQKWFGTAKETAGELSDKAKPHIDRAKEKVADITTGAKEATAETAEKVSEALEDDDGSS